MIERIDAPFRVLVPIDGSPLAEQAIAYAAALTRPGDRVILLHVAPSPHPPQTLRGFDLPVTDQYLAQCEREAFEVTGTAAAAWREILPEVDQRIAFGDPAEQIVACAGTEGADLIVMATHQRGALGRWRHGSVADLVARRAPVSVLVVRGVDAEVNFGPAPLLRFIVPLDGTALAEQALPVAERLARHTERPITLVHVTPPPLLTTVRFAEPMADNVAQEAEAELERKAVETLAAIAAGLEANGVATSWVVDKGKPSERIAEFARHGDVIVLASHGRAGFERLVLGSVAEKLIRTADAPVLIAHGQARIPARLRPALAAAS